MATDAGAKAITPDDADAGRRAHEYGHQVDLDVGENIITVTVTAEDESTPTYTVTVTREAPPTRRWRR